MWGLLIAVGILGLAFGALQSRLLRVLFRWADSRKGDMSLLHPFFGFRGTTAQAMQRHFVTVAYVIGTTAIIVGITGMALTAFLSTQEP